MFQGASTGQVLEHIATRSIRQTDNRPDVSDTVILIIDERSQDDVTNAVEMLKKQNVTVSTTTGHPAPNFYSVGHIHYVVDLRHCNQKQIEDTVC